MYKTFISPILDNLDSETMHVAAREALHLAESNSLTLRLLEFFADKGKRYKNDRLKILVKGVKFNNPIVVGAGWDKAGRAVRGLYTLGFGGVEVGSVLRYPQPGNPRPRQFIIGKGVALNRLGFNTPPGGLDEVEKNLTNYDEYRIPIGISIGKNKDIPDIAAPDMYGVVAERLYETASYFAINVSSPNTPGLRALQDKKPLTDIVLALNSVMDKKGARKPLFVKIAPELNNHEVNDVIQVVMDNGLAGIIATNTTINPDIKKKYGRAKDEMGGVSGNDPHFRQMATEKVEHIYRETQGKIIIIGVGGVNDTQSALEKILAGASLVQIVTGIRSEGTSLPSKINRGLIAWMDKEGVKDLKDIVGKK